MARLQIKPSLAHISISTKVLSSLKARIFSDRISNCQSDKDFRCTFRQRDSHWDHREI